MQSRRDGQAHSFTNVCLASLMPQTLCFLWWPQNGIKSYWLMGDRSISQTGIDRKRDVLAPETGISGEQGGCWLQVCLYPGVPGSVRAAFWHWVNSRDLDWVEGAYVLSALTVPLSLLLSEICSSVLASFVDKHLL